ncbi:uncharacterized protein [Eurosta solidaginis]|uniref:uncharacterized protein n=1 Tax=Eurosta solidaginis TaxID=178769 RepID=UPI003530799F
MLNVQSERTDDEKLQELLNLFELDCLFKCLRSNGVTYRCLKYVSKTDIKDAISNIGLRAEFREKLFAWRKSEFNIDDETISVESRVISWLEKSQTSNSTEFSTQIRKSSLLDISTILKSCSKGRSILSYYENHSGLTNTQREQLITILVEEANCNA